MKYIIFIFWNDTLRFIRKARSERGAKASERYALTYNFPHNKVRVKILSIDEILNWEQRGIDELERMMK
jgi:hypothetical protein